MRSESDPWRIDLLPLLTLVIWLSCLVVGLVGHYVIVGWPGKPVAAIKPTDATFVKVSVVNSPAVEALAPPSPVSPPTPPIPSLPPLPAVTPITPAIAFAVPVEGPVRIVPREAALPQPPQAGPHSAAPVYKEVFFGQGEGNQPAPEYPLECELAGQTGTVVVRFVVAADGHVTSAQVSQPCQWPLLNQAAERGIRETWTYPSGPVRHFYVKIVYASKQE